MKPNKNQSKYLKLAKIIKSEINNKKYALGEQIPTELQLMKKYKLSRDTVRKSIEYLVKEKLLYKLQGSGTFVSEEIYNQSLLKFYNFTDEMIKRGKIPSSKIISFELIKTDEKIKEKMNSDSKYVYELIRLRLANNIVVMYETTYLNSKILKNLTIEKLEKKPLYDVIKNEYELNLDSAREKFKAIITTKKIANKLRISSLKACMQLERYTYSENEILEYTMSVARGDKLTFEIDLKQ